MRSLRGRLTLGLTLVLAAVLMVAGVLAVREVDRDERSALDDRLRRTAELSRATALAAVNEELPDADRRLSAVLSATRSSLRLMLGETPLLEVGDPVPQERRLPDGLSTFVRGGVRYRGYGTSLRDPSLGGLAKLEVTTQLTALEERHDRLRRRLAVLGGLAVLVAAAGVFFASSLVLRPLRRLRATAASIAGDEDLARRVPASSGPSELRDLAASFNAMLARLGRSSADRERALEATRRFAAAAGHELRTPLTSAQATLSSLARHPELPSERRVAMALDAVDSHRRLVALLDGLQALARGDAAAPHEAVDLSEVAHAALSAAGDRHPEVSWESSVAEGVSISGWEPGLRSLFDNLLENAARHGRAGGGRVRLTLDASSLSVEDDGEGIPEDERERIFEPFVRTEDPDRPGSGLGLAIVLQQVRHHGATMAVERSEALGGARFVVRFAAGG
jgi:signal transduction histidine kinase